MTILPPWVRRLSTRDGLPFPRARTPGVRFFAASLVAFSLAGGCAIGGTGAGGDLPGCYHFRHDSTTTAMGLPWGIRLMDEPLSDWPALQERGNPRKASTLTPSREQDHPFGYWLPTGGDSVEIGYPAGGGFLLELARRGRDLEGALRAVGDALPPSGGDRERETLHVFLIWARCPEWAPGSDL